MIRQSVMVFAIALKAILDITFQPTWAWSCDNSETCYQFMQINEEDAIFEGVEDLHTGQAKQWNTAEPVPVKACEILFAGVTCGPISCKSIHSKRNLKRRGKGTSTHNTMQGLVDFCKAPAYNGAIKLVMVENIKNFLGVETQKEAGSCYDDLRAEFKAMQPCSFNSMHHLYSCEHYATPQTRKRVHISITNDSNALREETYHYARVHLEFRPRPLTDYLDDAERTTDELWMAQPHKDLNRGCEREHRDIRLWLADKGVKNVEDVYPPDLNRPWHELFGLPDDTTFVGMHRMTSREKLVLATNMGIARQHELEEYRVGCVLCGPINEGIQRFYWRLNVSPTIDSGTRMLILWKRHDAPWVFRFMSVTELFRLQDMQLLELCEPPVYAELGERLNMANMIELCGQAFNIAVMLVHFYSTVVAMERRLDV